MRIACWICKAAYTYSEYVILIDFLRQQWLPESDFVFRCMYCTLPALFTLSSYLLIWPTVLSYAEMLSLVFATDVSYLFIYY